MKNAECNKFGDELFIRVVQAAIMIAQNKDADEARTLASMAYNVMRLISETREDIPECDEITNIYRTFTMFHENMLGDNTKFKDKDLYKILEYMAFVQFQDNSKK